MKLVKVDKSQCIIKNCENLAGYGNMCSLCRANIYAWQRRPAAHRLRYQSKLAQRSDRLNSLNDVRKRK